MNKVYENVKFPTISPSNKRKGEIESIEAALEYYKENNVNEVVVQPKYMGSAIEIYLFRDIEQIYFTSRNGYQVKEKFNTNHVKDLYDKILKLYPNFKLAIIATEQLPWTTLSSNFVEREFLSYIESHENHLRNIKDNNLIKKLSKVIIPEGELKPHQKRTKDALEKLTNIDYSPELDKYKEQFYKFYNNKKIEFKAYCIHKIVLEDNTEIIPNNNKTFSLVNDDEYLIINLNEEIDYEAIKIFLNNQEEGVVIKPSTMYIEGVAPAVKVRNNNYLQLIYGVFFHNKFGEYYKKRKIKRKLELSIKEWELGWKLLNIPYGKINDEYEQILLDFKNLKENEKSLDKKL